MNTKEYAIVLSEAYTILNRLDKELYSKLPKDLIKFIKDNRDAESNFKYEPRKKLMEQNIKEETKSLISGIYLNYCVNETERQKLLAICEENEKKHLNEIKEQYNPDNLFKSKKVNKNFVLNEQDYVEMVKYKKEKWYHRILKKIKKILLKNK